MNRELLRAELIADEGLRLKPYRDGVGKLTIGVGRNLDDVGISEEEAMVLLDNDMARAGADARRALPGYDAAPEAVQRALANMAFNLGLPRLLGFRRLLAALEAGDYAAAAREALDSRWAEQVGLRAVRIAQGFRGGRA